VGEMEEVCKYNKVMQDLEFRMQNSGESILVPEFRFFVVDFIIDML